MRVLINAVSIRSGGAETYLINLLPILSMRTPENKYFLLVRESRAKLYSAELNNISIIAVSESRLNSFLKRLLFEHIAVPFLHIKKKYDLHWQADEMLSPVIGMMCMKKMVVYHTTPMVLKDSSTGDGLLYRWYNRSIRFVSAVLADVCICVSFHAKAELGALYPFALNKFSVVYHGVNTRQFAKNRLEKGNYLLSVSNRFIWKNYYRLIQAFKKAIDESCLPCNLLLVGTKKSEFEEQRITRFITDHKLQDRVQFLDYVEQEAIAELYLKARAYIFPSLQETFGMTILEAMASGLPVAAARWGVLPEVCGDAVRYFDPTDIDAIKEAIIDVMINDDMVDLLSKKSLEHVKSYSWESSALAYKKTFNKLTGMS